MKNVLTLCGFLCFAALLSGQSLVETHYQHLQDEPNATVVYVSGTLFSYISEVVPDNEEEIKKVKDIIANVESFNLITVPDLASPKTEYEKGIQTVKRTHEDLVLVRHKKNNFSLFIQEKGDVITELVGLGTSDSTFVVFSLKGRFDLNQISQLTEMIQEKKNLPVLETKAKEAILEYKVYPNPIAAGRTLNVDVPENMIGGQIQILDATGKLIQTYPAANTVTEISMNNYRLGNYIVDLSNGETSLRKQIIVIE